MRSLREHIHRLGGLEGIAGLGKYAYVAREGGWVAGNVDYALSPACRHRIEHRFIAALSRRIEHYHARPCALCYQLRQRGSRIGAYKIRVCNAVHGCIAPCILHRARHVLYARYMGRVFGYDHRYSACAAVYVHRLKAVPLGKKRFHLSIKLLRLYRIHLKERRRAYLKLEAAKLLRKRIVPPKRFVLIAKDNVCGFVVAVEYY